MIQIIAAVEILERAYIDLRQFKTPNELIAAAKLVTAAQRSVD